MMLYTTNHRLLYGLLPLAATIYIIMIDIVFGGIYPSYSYVSQHISELAATNAPHRAWVSYAGFLPFSIGIIIFSLAFFGGNMFRTTAMTKSTFHPFISRTKIVGYLFLFAGVALVILSFFPCDPGCPVRNVSLSANIHNWSAMLSFLFIIISQLLLGSLWFNEKYKNSYYLCCLILGLLSVPLYIMFKLTSPLFLIDELMPYKGITQRALSLDYLVWWTLSGFYFLRSAGEKAPASAVNNIQ